MSSLNEAVSYTTKCVVLFPPEECAACCVCLMRVCVARQMMNYRYNPDVICIKRLDIFLVFFFIYN